MPLQVITARFRAAAILAVLGVSLAGQTPAPAKHAKVNLVDINRASRKTLMGLPGIDGAQADRIIAGRPYPIKEQLVTGNVLLLEKYQAIRAMITVGVPKKQ